MVVQRAATKIGYLVRSMVEKMAASTDLRLVVELVAATVHK